MQNNMVKKRKIILTMALCLIFLFLAKNETKAFSYNIQPYTHGDVSNFPLYPKSTAPEPQKGECVYDENYGSTVCKVADQNEFASSEIGDAIRPIYSRWRIDNSDGSKYFLLKDGETPAGSGKGQTVIYNSADNSIYKIISEVNSGEPREFRWDYTGEKPNSMYYVTGCTFNEYNILTGVSTVVHNFNIDFPGCGRILNDVEGDSSRDSRYWAFMIQNPYVNGSYPMRAIVSYDKETDFILGVLDYAAYVVAGGTSSVLPTPNMVDISPRGQKIVLLNGRSWGADVTIPGPWTDEGSGVWSAPYQAYTNGNNSFAWVKSDGVALTKQNPIVADDQWINVSLENKLYIRLSGGESPQTHAITLEYGARPGDLGSIFDGPHAFDFDFSNPVKVCNDETHGGWAFDYAGNEVYVCQINNSGWPNAPADTIAYTNILTGETNTIIFHVDIGWDVGGWHFSRFYNDNIRGWVYMTTYSNYDTSNSWMRNQAVMLELKPYTEHPRVWRIADTHNDFPNTSAYSREAYSPITADGKYIYFGADWPGGDGTVDTYRVELPDNWWSALSGSDTTAPSAPSGLGVL